MKKIIRLKRLMTVSLFISILLILSITQGKSQVIDAWALGDGEKIFRNDDQHPDRKTNNIWDGKTIRLKGLYNEVLAFQVIVEADLKGAEAIEVSVDSPVEKSSGKVIGGNTLKYGPSGTIEIFSEHYLHVVDSTLPNWFYGSPAAAPKKLTGWIPDALIPANAYRGKGGFPIDIAPVTARDKHFRTSKLQNQGFWVDIHMPRDQKSFSPGIYYGSVKVIQEGKIIKEFPLEVDLLPVYLTDENPTNVWLFTSNVSEYFPEMSQKNLDNMVKFESHRHRVNASGGFRANSSPFNTQIMDDYKPYLDGSAFTPENGYHGAGEGTGESIFPIGMYGSPVLGNTKEELWKQSDLWVDWFSKNAPKISYFWYIIDEPTKPVFPIIEEKAGWINSNPGPGKNLPVFTTSHYQEELSDYIDMWAAYDGVDMKYLKSLKEKGGDYWFYNGNRPRTGSVILEGEAVDFRVSPWILYKYGVGQWFIWEGTHWQHNGQGPKAHLHQNVFTNPLTFINNDMDYGNGDGIVFYPGRMPFYPDEDRGLNQLLPSIRLKNIRRGQQDAAIMWMVEQKIGKDKVNKIISKILPKAMYEVEMKDKVQWSERGSDYDKVREELIRLL